MCIPFDSIHGKCFDLTRRSTQLLVLSWITVGLVWLVHLGTPCTLYSIATRHRPDRSSTSISMECTRFTAEVITACHRHGVTYTLENPKTLRLFAVPCVRDALTATNAFMVEFDCCRYGCTYRKPTLLATNECRFQQLSRLCTCNSPHEILRGKVKIPIGLDKTRWYWKTTLAGQYAAELCQVWARVVSGLSPKSALRVSGEDRLSSFWQHEVSKVSGHRCPRLSMPPCPTQTSSPWKDKLDEWGC